MQELRSNRIILNILESLIKPSFRHLPTLSTLQVTTNSRVTNLAGAGLGGTRQFARRLDLRREINIEHLENYKILRGSGGYEVADVSKCLGLARIVRPHKHSQVRKRKSCPIFRHQALQSYRHLRFPSLDCRNITPNGPRIVRSSRRPRPGGWPPPSCERCLAPSFTNIILGHIANPSGHPLVKPPRREHAIGARWAQIGKR